MTVARDIPDAAMISAVEREGAFFNASRIACPKALPGRLFVLASVRLRSWKVIEKVDGVDWMSAGNMSASSSAVWMIAKPFPRFSATK